jgi:hypothetical protein
MPEEGTAAPAAPGAPSRPAKSQHSNHETPTVSHRSSTIKPGATERRASTELRQPRRRSFRMVEKPVEELVISDPNRPLQKPDQARTQTREPAHSGVLMPTPESTPRKSPTIARRWAFGKSRRIRQQSNRRSKSRRRTWDDGIANEYFNWRTSTTSAPGDAKMIQLNLKQREFEAKAVPDHGAKTGQPETTGRCGAPTTIGIWTWSRAANRYGVVPMTRDGPRRQSSAGRADGREMGEDKFVGPVGLPSGSADFRLAKDIQTIRRIRTIRVLGR